MRIIYTAGYQGRKPADLAAEVRAVNGKVLDIRLSAASYNPNWRGYALSQQFGHAGYQHVPDLGNVNYRERENGKGIRIRDMEKGLQQVLMAITAGFTPVLLCGCPRPATCHRSVVAARLREMGFEVRELPGGAEE